MCYSRPTVYAYVPNFVSIGLLPHPLLAKNTNFSVFWISAFSGVANWQQSESLLNTGAQLLTFPYPTASISFLYSNVFMAKSDAQALTFKSMTDKQTNRQKTQRFWPPRRRMKSEPHQTWHGDRGPRECSCTAKTFGSLTHSFATRGR